MIVLPSSLLQETEFKDTRGEELHCTASARQSRADLTNRALSNTVYRTQDQTTDYRISPTAAQ